MKIVWFSWKDKWHPEAGGAEIVKHEILRRLIDSGNQVVVVTSHYAGSLQNELKEGVQYYRVGGKYGVYLAAFAFYQKNLKGWEDVAIDECNTIPFFTQKYIRTQVYVIVYQLAREIWFYQMTFPLSWIGYLVEPLLHWSLKSAKVITISESTKRDLIKLGYANENIVKIRMASEAERASDLSHKKYGIKELLIIFVGSIRPMKRPMHALAAFERAKLSVPGIRLKIIGDGTGRYRSKFKRRLESSPFAKDIRWVGGVSNEEKLKSMSESALLLVTSVREGWGIVVSEAASQGTPALVYDVGGLRDSVINGKTGIVVAASIEEMAKQIINIAQNEELRMSLSKAAWESTLNQTFENTFNDFYSVIASNEKQNLDSNSHV